MKLKELIQKFNRSDTILVISDYPEINGKNHKNYGMAWHTKELLTPMAEQYNKRFVVLGEKTDGKNTPKVYHKGNVLVLRVFDQKHPSLFPRILKWLITFGNIKEIHVHSEFCANGGVKTMMLIAPFLLLIKLTGKQITFYSHNVVVDLSSIATHLNIKKNSLKYQILNNGFKLYYRILDVIVNRFVVMDEVILNRLAQFVDPKKIVHCPFWITPQNSTLSKGTARKKLGIKKDEFVLLYFGFLTHYKGADWIIKTVKKLHRDKKYKHIRLIMAGGPAYSLKEKPYYKCYYQNLLDLAKSDSKIHITGFVSEEDIEMYFKASDLATFTYRGLIGGSGSLTHAIAFNTPFVVSRKMSEILSNQDISAILINNDLSAQEVSFDHNLKSFQKLLAKATDSAFLRKLSAVSTDLAEARSRGRLALQYRYTLFRTEETPVFKRSIELVESI